MNTLSLQFKNFLRKHIFLLFSLSAFCILLSLVTTLSQVHAAGSNLAVDAHVGVNQTSNAKTITSPNLTTSQAGEMIVVFLGSDGPRSGNQTFSAVTGGGLNFTLAKRMNVQKGTAEIWYAYASSKLTNTTITATRSNGSYHGMIDVLTFTGSATTIGVTGSKSAANGAPNVTLTTSTNNSWIWGAGNDWTGGTARTVGANQTLARQFVDPNLGTYWSQYQTATTPTAGTSVTLNDTAPTKDVWDMVAVEIIPSQITPTITPLPTIIPNATPTMTPTVTPTPTIVPTPTGTVSATPTPTTLPTATPTPTSSSGQAMPTGDLPGWKQIFADDFTKDAATGSWGASCTNDGGANAAANKIVYTGANGTQWRTYPDCYTDTYQKRPYRSDQVLSVHDGVLDFYLRNVNGKPAGANPSPVINAATASQYQTYGRYVARFKVDNNTLSEYYAAWLLWPVEDNKYQCAESDFPEGSLSTTSINAFAHYGCNGSQDAYSSNTSFTQWHTFTQEWAPGIRRYYIDGQLLGTSIHSVYAAPERWQLQTETNGNGTHSGHLLVDWVAVYSYVQ